MVKFTLGQFETIGPTYSKILAEKMDVKYVDDFFKFSIHEIVQKTQIDESRVQKFFEILELFKIPGMNIKNAELLNFININSIEELSHQEAMRIFYKLQELDKKTYLIVLELPTFSQINKWIYYAKVMTKRIKDGLNIPLILLPMMNMDYVSELAKYNIITIEDFIYRSNLIRNLRFKTKIPKQVYESLIDFMSLVQIKGIDLYFAKIFYEAGIKNAKSLEILEVLEILSKIKLVQQKQGEILEEITEEILNEIKKSIKEGH